jgi:hypothetical protein
MQLVQEFKSKLQEAIELPAALETTFSPLINWGAVLQATGNAGGRIR